MNKEDSGFRSRMNKYVDREIMIKISTNIKIKYFLRTRVPEGTLTRTVFTEFTLSMRDFTHA